MLDDVLNILHNMSPQTAIAFRHWLETDRIVCKPSFVFSQAIHPATSTEMYSGSLYQAEDGDLTAPEKKMALNLTSLDNIRWWCHGRVIIDPTAGKKLTHA